MTNTQVMSYAAFAEQAEQTLLKEMFTKKKKEVFSCFTSPSVDRTNNITHKRYSLLVVHD